MAPKWTAAQQAAIDYRGRNLLLSAAAGSGKTATLTERIVRLLCAPDSDAEISRMLCVTFTRAAAAELRERIGRALRDALDKDRTNARLTRQLYDLGRAQITTIHAFCLSAIRPHATELELPSTFTVAAESETRALSRRVMADTLSAFFNQADADFLRLADTLGSARREDSLDEVLLALAQSLASRGMSAADLAALADGMDSGADFFLTPVGQGTRERVRRMAEHYRAVFLSLRDAVTENEKFCKAYLPALESSAALAGELLAAAENGSYSAARDAILAFPRPRLGTVKTAEQTEDVERFKACYSDFKDEVDALREKNFSLPPCDLDGCGTETARLVRCAAAVLDNFFSEMSARKRESGTVDFADLESMTARLFTNADGTPSDIARHAGQAYDYIFIDEYQDTNRAQDAIFSALAAGGAARFMVGDIKQSIYRFRGAEPDVFSAYRRAWQGVGAEGDSIFMRENFRCDKTVVDFVNLVSRHLFSGGSIPFTDEDTLAYAKPQDENYRATPVRLRLLSSAEAEEGEEPPESEADYVARTVSAMMANTRRADGTPLRPGDFAILLRSPNADGGAFADALARRGIPCERQTAASLWEEPEVTLMLSILRVIDNPTRDIDLAAALKSPVFGFSLDDLVHIRRACRGGTLYDALRVCAGILPPEEVEDADADTLPAPPVSDILFAQCRDFCDRLAVLRRDARGMRADKLILRLYAETDIRHLAEAAPDRDTDAVTDNLRSLYDRARLFSGSGVGAGLYAFLSAIEAEIEETPSASAATPTENAVQILSIHHSKGLEYPVCFLSRTAKKHNKQDARAALLFDPGIGAVMRLLDPGGLVRCDTPHRRSVAAAIEDAATEEEMRVLYVAMTRAREHLIVTAAVPDPEKILAAAEASAQLSSRHAIFRADSMIEWMLSAIASARVRGEDISCVTVARAEAETDSAVPAVSPLPEEEKADGCTRTAEEWESLFRERFAFRYPHAHLRGIPAKLTVSKLTPDILDGGDDADASLLPRVPGVPAPTERNRAPRFLQGKTVYEASFAGTATHMFLQFCDFVRLRDCGAEAERERMRVEGYLTAAHADAVRMDEIERFRHSDTLRAITEATWIRREFRFNASLPAANFTRDETLAAALRREGTDVIVQGVIDCLFADRDGRVTLLDYKTDRLSPADLADPDRAARTLWERHGTQLTYYRAALAEMLGQSVERCLIYSLPLGQSLAEP